MATKKEAVKEAPKGKAKSDEAEDFEFTVDDLAKATGLQPASVRVGLRESDFERSGKKWGWNSQKEFDKVVAYFEERAERKPNTSKEEAKPAKGKAAGKGKAEAADDKPTRKSKK